MTQAEAASLAPPATSPPDDERPDWSSVTETIRCPLCAYELRGLVEPRCPECGFAFHWPDLLDPTRRKHPYLFEHHPRSNVRSFFRTMLGNFGPVRFWSSLKPSQPSRPGRLVLYWLIASLLLPVGYAGFFVYTAVRHAKEHEAYRARYATWVTQNLGQFTDAGVIASIQAAGGPRAWVDVEIPPTRSPRYLLYFYHSKFEQHVYPNGEPGQHLEVFLVLIRVALAHAGDAADLSGVDAAGEGPNAARAPMHPSLLRRSAVAGGHGDAGGAVGNGGTGPRPLYRLPRRGRGGAPVRTRDGVAAVGGVPTLPPVRPPNGHRRRFTIVVTLAVSVLLYTGVL